MNFLKFKVIWKRLTHGMRTISLCIPWVTPGMSEPGRKKYVVVDKYRIHSAKPVQAFLAEHQDEIELVCLPTSSPKLNPVERFWKQVRRQVTHHHFFQTMERLMDAVTPLCARDR